MKKKIRLTTEKELQIYMDPVRQRILQTMQILGTPVTAKKLADLMHMTPASAKYHLTQLQRIGLVEPDHTETIHGILAQYYRNTDADVILGMDKSDYVTEASIIAENQVHMVFQDLLERVGEYRASGKEGDFPGDLHTGVIRLTKAQMQQLRETVCRFLDENRTGAADTLPYEFALIYCEGEKRT